MIEIQDIGTVLNPVEQAVLNAKKIELVHACSSGKLPKVK